MISTVSFNEYVDVVAHRTSQPKKVVKLVMMAYLAHVAQELEENGSAGVLGLFDLMDKTKVPLQVRKAASLGQGVSLVPKTFFKSLVKG